MKNKTVITGAGGFLGKAIARNLLERGDDVYSFSRNFYPELESMGVKQFTGDLSDPKAVENACKGMDVVFHVAAKAGVWGKWKDYYDTNVTGTKNIIDACLNNSSTYLVHTSSPSVIFNGTDMEGVNESVPYPSLYHAPYPETKALAEKMVIDAVFSSHLKAVILRPHLIWGPGDNHLLPGIIARAKRLKKVGDGTNRVDTIYIDNAADAHILAADKLKLNPSISGNVYFISQDEPVRLWDMVDNLLDAAGLPPVKGSVSAKTAETAGWLLEKFYNLAGTSKEPPMTRFMAKELATSHWFDISRAKEDLGYTPKVSTKKGLENLKKWLNR
ncbi:Sterol-4-alpha-carboxylate 3-dehydrogenase (Decarboxylating) [Desulfamplus magnetovallimortis]|uniref:Sterol-4-alpha-carboxylate 3-dehydrogenase (Decarboxylating) n=1 Tax=Desulfamplus magnetovallimortis TaxID=1246637 RepID=A0A1W1HEJ0_9BACT|nr:NAD-dependent epimerase/dehydratase family protein [Desulfamplus magnetovallimortis]SLM30843.1 Sterol-4-alpha-carboxylate 3-dehydrogenase (Decarboxylating) [Desulfamplus magnetovallimortis]